MINEMKEQIPSFQYMRNDYKRLNLGSGDDYRKGWTNIDFRGNIKVDISHDLNKFPYPFKDNTFDYVLINHVLEHLDNPIRVLQEMVRICKRDAYIEVNVPHALSYAQVSDIQHKNNFTENSFTDKALVQYDLENLRLIQNKFVFKNKYKKYIPFKKYLKIYLNGIYDDLSFGFWVKK